MITTEALLVSPAGFGIATASAAQLAAARIIDGRPLGELRDHPDAIQLVGGPDALAALPSENGEQPIELCLLASIRSAKTILGLCAAIRATQVVDVSGLTHGEVPRISIVSLKLDTAAAAFRMLGGVIQASPALRALLVGDPQASSLMLRHPSGRPIEIACVAGAPAGGGLVSRWSAGFIADEAPRMSGSADGTVINLDDARTAVLGRLLPGAQALYIGSPWAPQGPIYDLVQEHWQKPSAALVVLRGTGPMLNPQWWTPERCAALEARNPTAHQTDVLGNFADPETGLVSPVGYRKNTREQPVELPPIAGVAYSAAIDPGEGRLTLAIISREKFARTDDPKNWFWRYRVAFAREYPGDVEQAWRQIADDCARYGLKRAWTDQYAATANAAIARRYRLQLESDPWTGPSRLEAFLDFATLVATDSVEFPPDRQVRRDVLSVKKRITQQGMTIVLPRTSDKRHCDFAPALVMAIKHAGAVVPTLETPVQRQARQRLLQRALAPRAADLAALASPSFDPNDPNSHDHARPNVISGGWSEHTR